MNLGTLTIEMAANVARLSKDMDAARRTVDRTFGSIESQVSRLKGIIGGLFAGATVGAFVGKIVQVQREFDVLNSSLKTVTGSSAAAAQEMEWIKQFAKETPFGLAQATQGFVKMKALGLEPTRASLTSFGNTASAMGKDLNQMIEAVADASTGEFERLKEFGIKAKQQGNQVSLTFQGVTTTIGNNAAEITKYLEAIGNNQFAGAMAERAKTLDGAIASLGDSWDELFRTISNQNAGGLIHDSVTLAAGAIEDATTILRALTEATQENARETGAMATAQNGLATIFETLAVLAVNVKYVLVGVGTEIGGIAAQIVQFAQGNFSAVSAIRAAMVEEAKIARQEVDATTERILNARKAAKDFSEWATRNASAATDPRRIDLPKGGDGSRTPTAGATASAKDEAKAAELLLKAAQDRANARNKEAEAINAFMLAQQEAASKSLQSVNDRIRSFEDEAAAVEMSESLNISLAEAIERVAIARLREKQQKFNEGAEGWEAIEREIAAREKLAGMIGNKASRDIAKENAKKAADDWKQASEKINDTLTDALMRGFESGKDFAKNLRDTVINMFQTMVLRPVISATIGGTLGLSSGAANAGTVGGIVDIFSAGQSLYNALTNGVSNSIATGFAKLAGTSFGQSIGLSNATAIAGNNPSAYVPAGGQLTSLGETLSSSLGMAGNAFAGYAISSGLSGGYQTGLGNKVNVLAALASAYFGPIAGVVGAAVNRAFGRKFKDAGLDATFGGEAGGEAGFIGQQYKFYQGGWFRSDKTEYTPLDAETTKSMGQRFKGLQTSAALMAQALGLATDSIANYTYGLRISFNGLSEDQIQQTIAEQFDIMANEMADGVLKTHEAASALAKEGETASETLARLGTSLITVNSAFEMLGMTMWQASIASGDLASQLIDAVGGAEAFSQATGSYFANYYTQTERVAYQTQTIANALQKVGIEMPSTRAEFRALVEEQQAMGPAGKDALAVLLSINGAFASLTQEVEKTAESVLDFARRTARTTLEFNRIKGLANAGNSSALAILGVPGFASGGYHDGGLRLVGENGPELEVTGPSRIISAPMTETLMSGLGKDNLRLESLVSGLTEEVKMLRAEVRADVQHNAKTARILSRITPDGDAIATREAAPL